MKAPVLAWNWTPANDSTLRQMWRDNATIPEIADEIGCSGYQVNRRRITLQLLPRPVGWKPTRNPQTAAKAYRPEPPKCRNGDAAFAAAMAGRTFDSVRIKSGDSTRVWPHIVGVGSEAVGASSLELNA